MELQSPKKNKKTIRWTSCLLIAKKFFFWNFWGWKMWCFVTQKVDGKVIFADYWKVLVLKFSVMGNTVFFKSRSWWKDDIYWLLRSSCFELFGDGKYDPFFTQKATSSFWAFHGILGLAKYGFSSSVPMSL